MGKQITCTCLSGGDSRPQHSRRNVRIIKSLTVLRLKLLVDISLLALLLFWRACLLHMVVASNDKSAVVSAARRWVLGRSTERHGVPSAARVSNYKCNTGATAVLPFQGNSPRFGGKKYILGFRGIILFLGDFL